jgi:hypothetical protein
MAGSWGPDRLRLRIVPAYRHLGTWLQAGNVHAKEVAKRGAIARATWGGLTKPFYNKSYVSLATKAQVFRSAAMSQFFYNLDGSFRQRLGEMAQFFV